MKARNNPRRRMKRDKPDRDMMERLVNIDFEESNLFRKRVSEALQDADDIVIENPWGTHFQFSVKGTSSSKTENFCLEAIRGRNSGLKP